MAVGVRERRADSKYFLEAEMPGLAREGSLVSVSPWLRVDMRCSWGIIFKCCQHSPPTQASGHRWVQAWGSSWTLEKLWTCAVFFPNLFPKSKGLH